MTPRIRDRDLATVQTHIAAADPGETATKDFLVEVATPTVLTEFYTPGTTWFPSLTINPKPGTFDSDGLIWSDAVIYKLGKPIIERWNVGVFGPALAKDTIAARTRDLLSFSLPFFADQGQNHTGASTVGETNMTLSQNGQVIGESPFDWGFFFVPPEPGPYELTMKSIRTTNFSSEMRFHWKFQTPEGNLPLMVVRYAPNLDEHNRAKAGRLFAIPLHVEQFQGSAHGQLKDLRMSASFDDGKTWHRVLLIGKGLSRTALLIHPRGKGFVSLRATATDSLGNSVDQTTIHAYELTP
jgi:hypothetical protein